MEYVKTTSSDSLPSVRLTWQDSKTDLTELIYLLDISKRTLQRYRTSGGLPYQNISQDVLSRIGRIAVHRAQFPQFPQPEKGAGE